MAERRVVCICGQSVLSENWSNHLLRQDGRKHGPPSLDVEALIAETFSIRSVGNVDLGENYVSWSAIREWAARRRG